MVKNVQLVGKEEGGKGGSAQEEVAHPLGHDHVDLLGQVDVLHLALDDAASQLNVSSTNILEQKDREEDSRDDLAQTVVLDVALGLEGDSTGIDGVDLLRARLGREHGEDACFE